MSPPRPPEPARTTPRAAARRPRPGFYRRLTPAQKREYDRSDATSVLALRPDPALGQSANRLVEALETEHTGAVCAAAQDLVDRTCAALVRRRREPVPRVRVLRARPRLSDGEFHGLYTRNGRGECEIRVWMLTAAHRQVVRPRTFLRTLLHELVHHFDMVLLDLPSSFHTAGFHARESSLLRALERSGAVVPSVRDPRPAAPPAAKPRRRGGSRPTARAPRPKPARKKPAQLSLFPEG